MTTIPVQRSDAAPAAVEDTNTTAEAIVNDPSKEGSPEWLAAKQFLAREGQDGVKSSDGLTELEREMQALRGLSEI